jgi:hypothetical protein
MTSPSRGFRPVAAPLSSRRTLTVVARLRAAASPAEGVGLPLAYDSVAERVVSEMSRDDVALATGSVYLIDELYPHFLKRDGRVGLFPEAGA